MTVILGNLVTPISIIPVSFLKTMSASTFSRMSYVALAFMLYHVLTTVYLYTFGIADC